MSTRTVPRTLDERVAALEEYVRAVQAQNAVTPTDVRYLYDAKGAILVALGTSKPAALELPSTGPPSTGAIVLRYNPGTDLGVEWAWVDAPAMTVSGA